MHTPCYCGYHHDDESDLLEYDTEYDSDYDIDCEDFEVSLGNIQVDLSSYMDIGPNETYMDSYTDTYYGLPNDYDYADWRMNITMVHNELIM